MFDAGAGSREPTRKGGHRAVVELCGLAAVRTEGLYFGLCHQFKGFCDPGEGTAPPLVTEPLCPPLAAWEPWPVWEFVAASYLGQKELPPSRLEPPPSKILCSLPY